MGVADPDTRYGQRVLIHERLQGVPRDPPVLTPLRERVFPLPPGEVPKRMELPRIPRDPVVVEVATQDPVNGPGLRFDGMVFDPAEQVPHPGFCPAEAFPLRLEHRLA